LHYHHIEYFKTLLGPVSSVRARDESRRRGGADDGFEVLGGSLLTTHGIDKTRSL